MSMHLSGVTVYTHTLFLSPSHTLSLSRARVLSCSLFLVFSLSFALSLRLSLSLFLTLSLSLSFSLFFSHTHTHTHTYTHTHTKILKNGSNVAHGSAEERERDSVEQRGRERLDDTRLAHRKYECARGHIYIHTYIDTDV